jgi:hypothetical protein
MALKTASSPPHPLSMSASAVASPMNVDAAATPRKVPNVGMSAAETGEWLASIGPKYGEYKKNAIDNSFDGKILCDMVDEPLPIAMQLLTDLGITNHVHRLAIFNTIKKQLADVNT